jgi:4-diphosphocytidyl-2C-methyl-D-erythritol kinase
MIMQTVALADRLTMTEGGGRPRFPPTCPTCPVTRNLAVRAAMAYFEAAGRAAPGLAVHIEKVLPVCAGMAGGSSDAAAILRGLQEKYHLLSDEALQIVAAQTATTCPIAFAADDARGGAGELLTAAAAHAGDDRGDLQAALFRAHARTFSRARRGKTPLPAGHGGCAGGACGRGRVPVGAAHVQRL